MALLGICACKNPVDACRERFSAGAYDQAVAICARAFAKTSHGEAAVRAAGAAYHLRRSDEVRAWAERLRGHPGEAGILYYLGRQQDDAGDAELARATHERALEIARQSNDAREAGRNAFMLYRLARRQSAHTAALTYAHASLMESRRAGNAEGQRNAIEAIGLVLYELGDVEGARRALAELRDLTDAADARVQARIAQKEALLLEAEKRLSLARDAHARGLALARAAGDRQMERDQLINLTSTSLDLGDLTAAQDHLGALKSMDPDSFATLFYQGRLAQKQGRPDQAAGLLSRARDSIDDPDWLWQIDLEAGHVAEQAGDPAAAEAAYRRAIGLVEDMRKDLVSNELRAWMLARTRRPYEALFRLYARQGNAAMALDTLDRAKARAVVDAFVDPFVRRAEPPAPDATPAAQDEDLPAWMRQAMDRAGVLATLLPAMSTAPMTASARPPVDELIRAPGARAALVYFRLEDALWLVRVAGGRVDLTELVASPAALDELDGQIDTLVRAPGDRATAEALGRLLLPPGMLPDPGTPLYLVADGPLMRLPFAALRVADQYLIERHDLVHVPSLGALAAIEARARPAPGRPAVLGDPRGDLPDAAREVAHVATLLGTSPRVGDAATVAALRQAAGARVLHLATHLEVDARGATLLLADGAVDAAQVVTWRLGPEMVVLAGCASAVQLTHRHGREMWGSMAAAFLASGARQVIAALWSIPDGPTRAFIERFYAEDGARDPAGALARAQRAWIAEHRDPELWAPFVLLGTAAPGQTISR